MLREVHDFLAERITEESKIGHAVQPSLDGDWPAIWYQGAAPDFSTLILAGPEGPDFDAGTTERATFVVLNDPAHVLDFTGYLRWTVANHKPVLQPAEENGETIAVEVCPIDGAECEPLLRMANIWERHPSFKREWRWESSVTIAEILARGDDE
jgi:hypothetical protein